MEPYQKLEKQWAEFTGTEYAVSCNTGTAALHLALMALQIKEGDEVIVPEFTMAAPAFAVSYTGATPVFVDCDDTLNIDPNLIERNITEKTKAIIVVHIYGKPCDMDSIMEIASRYNLKVIEDCAEAHGATYKGKTVGSIGDMGCFSFYKNKIFHAEEGGMVTTNNKLYNDRMKFLKCQAFTKDHDFFHPEVGYNYRMPNSQANMVLDMLEKKEYIMMHRQLPDGSVKWVYEQFFTDKEERDALYNDPSIQHMQPRLFFKPMSMMPMYFNESYKTTKAFYYSERGLYFPFKYES